VRDAFALSPATATISPLRFDFVNPVLALWRLIDRRSKLGFDKAKPINDAMHAPGFSRRS
jgi:hypothetical protein